MTNDENKLPDSETTLLIAANNRQTGKLLLFSNRSKDFPHSRPITRERIMASCSIPPVCPWIQGSGTNDLNWDGPLLAITPPGGALELTKDKDINIPPEVVVVMLIPWLESEKKNPGRAQATPGSFGEALSWILDWMLL